MNFLNLFVGFVGGFGVALLWVAKLLAARVDLSRAARLIEREAQVVWVLGSLLATGQPLEQKQFLRFDRALKTLHDMRPQLNPPPPLDRLMRLKSYEP